MANLNITQLLRLELGGPIVFFGFFSPTWLQAGYRVHHDVSQVARRPFSRTQREASGILYCGHCG